MSLPSTFSRVGIGPKAMHLIGRVVDDEVHPVQKQKKKKETQQKG